MNPSPKWYLPVAILALLWNLMGCAAYLQDVSIGPAELAQMTQAQQAMYKARPVWAVAAMAIAVWGGAAGSLGLILRRRWAMPLFVASLLGLLLQDTGMFLLTEGLARPPAAAFAVQGTVLLIALALLGLARKAGQAGWLR